MFKKRGLNKQNKINTYAFTYHNYLQFMSVHIEKYSTTASYFFTHRIICCIET